LVSGTRQGFVSGHRFSDAESSTRKKRLLAAAAADLIRNLNVPVNTDNLRPAVTRNLYNVL